MTGRPVESSANMRRVRAGLTVGGKLALTTVAVLLVVTYFVTSQLATRARRSLLDAKEGTLREVSAVVAAGLAAPLLFDDADAARGELENLKSHPDFVGATVWKVGARAPIAIAGAAPPTASFDEGVRGADGLSWVRSSERIDVTRPIKALDDGHTLGTLRVALSLAPENQTSAALLRSIVWTATGLAFGTALVLIAATRRLVVAPLTQLSSAARRIARGDRGVTVKALSRDEMGELAVVFNTMSEAIVEREQRLALATASLRELFDHMRQAIVVVGHDGNVEGASSAAASALFGKDLEGKPLVKLLVPPAQPGPSSATSLETEAITEWLQAVFSFGAARWSEVAELAPEEATVRDESGQQRFLRLEFVPILHGAEIARLMLLATDETDKRRLEQAVRTSAEEHERQLAAMRRLIAGGGALFVRFLIETRARLDEVGDAVRDEALTVHAFDGVLQTLHTLRGEARSFDLLDVEKHVAVLEDTLSMKRPRGPDAARAGGPGGAPIVDEATRKEMTTTVSAAIAALYRARDVFVQASPIGAALLDQVTVSRKLLGRLTELAGERRDEVGETVRALAARPLGEMIGSLMERAPLWASSIDKRAQLVIEGGETPLSPALAKVMSGILIHLVRNAIVHGIEPADERAAAGKDPIGTVTIRGELDGGAARVSVSDDGRGVDRDAIVRRAIALGFLARDDGRPLVDLCAVPGLSTAAKETDLAGHGMGFGAVRAAAEAAHARLAIDSEPGKGTRVTLTVESRT